MTISRLQSHCIHRPFRPIRRFIENTLTLRMFTLITDWLEGKEGWTSENTRRVGFDIAPIPGSTQGIDPLSFRMTLEAIRIRDLDLFRDIPEIKTVRCRDFRREIGSFLSKELLSDPENETLFAMNHIYFRKYPEYMYTLFDLLEHSAAQAHFKLVKLILSTYEVPLSVRRNLLHYPFDQSVNVKDEERRKSYRELMLLLDPQFELPRWLSL